MSEDLDPRDDLAERLAALGRRPVSPAVQSAHLTAMASVPASRSFRTSLAGRLKVGAGVLAGFLLGASGLTAAGAMGPLQPVAAKVASEVANVEVPQGPKDKAQKAAKAAKAKSAKAQGEGATNKIWGAANGCPEQGEFRNRGAFLKAAKDAERDDDPATTELLSFEDARKSDCGKGLDADGDVVEPKDEETKEPTDVEGAENGKSDEDHGKKDAAPGLEDKGEPGDKAKGPKDGEPESKPETPAGPPAEAGNSGVTPPVVDPPAEPAPDTPAPAGDGDDADGEV